MTRQGMSYGCWIGRKVEAVTEIKFCGQHGVTGNTAAAAGKGDGLGLGFSAGASNQISLMKWENMIKPIGLKLPSVAISPLGIDHFISEMTDCTQQQKIPAPARPLSRLLRLYSPSPHAGRKI